MSLRAAHLIIAAACATLALSSAHAGTTYTYDDLGRLTKAQYDNGKEIDYSFDQAGNRTTVVTQTTPAHTNTLKTPRKKKKRAVSRH